MSANFRIQFLVGQNVGINWWCRCCIDIAAEYSETEAKTSKIGVGSFMNDNATVKLYLRIYVLLSLVILATCRKICKCALGLGCCIPTTDSFYNAVKFELDTNLEKILGGTSTHYVPVADLWWHARDDDRALKVRVLRLQSRSLNTRTFGSRE